MCSGIAGILLRSYRLCVYIDVAVDIRLAGCDYQV